MVLSLDSECNIAIIKDDVPQKEFNAALLMSSPISIDVATGIKVFTNSEWGMMLPLDDGSMQTVCTLSVNQVTSKMPCISFKHSLDKIKAEHP